MACDLAAAIARNFGYSIVASPDALSEMARRHLNVAQSEALIEHLLAGKGARHRRIIPLPKDMRAFFNTLEHAVDIIKKGGVAAVSTRRETAAYIECVIRVPKPAVRQ